MSIIIFIMTSGYFMSVGVISWLTFCPELTF